ncbi:MAG: polysaccharide biosynthesis/export family protein [Betaproteobacteria bacterium]
MTVVAGTELPPPNRADLSGQDREYVLGPLDKVSVEIFGLPELSRTIMIDGSGRISLPLAGSLQASGRTTVELAQQIEAALQSHHVRGPQVSVNVTEASSQFVTVEGEVETPGTYPVAGRQTLMRTLARAQGTTEFARLSHVVVIRDVNGQRLAALYDVRAIRRGLYPDPQIYANDVVTVGESQSRRLFRDLIQGSGLITTPIIALIQSGVI